MLVVHAACAAGGEVRLWAEDTGRSVQEPPAARPAADAGPSPHPFAAPPADLARLAAGRAAAEPIVILLPSTATGPLPSPELTDALAARPSAAAGPGPGGLVPATRVPSLRGWLVDTLDADLPRTLEALAQPGEDFRLGASALFLLAVAAFASDLVGRGRVLPALGWDGAGPAARWRPVLTGPDADRRDELVAAMPPAFRAAVTTNSPATNGSATSSPATNGAGSGPLEDPPAGAADLVLGVALDRLVDAHARDRLRRAGRAPAAPGRVRSPRGHAAAGWLRALGGEPRVRADEVAVREFAATVEAWRSGARVTARMRVCFRLAEPGALSRTAPGDDDAWRLDFLLQAVDDPGVQVSADEVWRRRPAGPGAWVTDAEESLLAGLGRAAVAWPGLGRALHEARPTGLDLAVEQAQSFLQTAGDLEQEGFGVLVPSWWVRPVRPTARLTVRAVNPVTPILRDATTDLDQLVDFRWAVSLGEVELSRAELDSLAAARGELVRVHGRWTRMDPGALAGLDLGPRTDGRMSVRDVLAYAGLFPAHAPADADEVSGAGVEVAADGWLGALLAGQDDEPGPGPDVRQVARRLLAEPPAGLGVRLRPYQAHGLAWLALLDRLGVGALLADDMGLGKTIQVLALEVLTRGAAPREPTLVVCPTSVLGNWAREAERVAPGLRVHTHHGPGRPSGDALAGTLRAHDLVLTTYPQLIRDVDELRGFAFERLVLDEAQQIKNAATVQARAARQLTARHRVALTGTPVENRLGDLWSIMRVVSPGLLGSAASFRARYAVPIERYGDVDAAARLRRRIRPVVLRRVKTDPAVLRDLPAKVELRQLCTLTTEQAALYRAVVDDMMERLRDRSSQVRRSGVVLAAMTRLKQVCNHPAHLLGDSSALPGRSGKLARLEELLAQVVAGGERALCFTQFARFGAMLAPYLSARLGIEVQFLHGGLRPADRDALVARFQAGRGPGVFLLSLKAGGTGVNLTAANHVVHIDRWWNPAVEAQATDRAYRIGQPRDVWVRTLLCMGTLEERIDRILVDKAALARTVVSGGESWLAALSNDELRDLVTLAPEAVRD